MDIDFGLLANALTENNLMHKAPAAMSKEEIETLCKLVCFYAKPLGVEDVPFA